MLTVWDSGINIITIPTDLNPIFKGVYLCQPITDEGSLVLDLTKNRLVQLPNIVQRRHLLNWSQSTIGSFSVRKGSTVGYVLKSVYRLGMKKVDASETL